VSLFDRALVLTLPLAPRVLVDRVAARYMAGSSVDDALETVRELAAGGLGGGWDQRRGSEREQ